MDVRSAVMIILCTAIICMINGEQIIYEGFISKAINNSCRNPDGVPFLNSTTCISRVWHSVIFLISIILTALNILFLIILLILFCIGRLTWSKPSPTTKNEVVDHQSSFSDMSVIEDNDSERTILPSKQISKVLQNIINTSPAQTRPHHNFDIPPSNTRLRPHTELQITSRSPNKTQTRSSDTTQIHPATNKALHSDDKITLLL